jgi:hypothetical protein
MVSAVQVLNLVPILGPIATIVVSVALAPVTAERYLGFVWLKNQPDQNVPVDKSNYWWLLGFVAAGIGGHASYRPGQS